MLAIQYIKRKGHFYESCAEHLLRFGLAVTEEYACTTATRYATKNIGIFWLSKSCASELCKYITIMGYTSLKSSSNSLAEEPIGTDNTSKLSL